MKNILISDLNNNKLIHSYILIGENNDTLKIVEDFCLSYFCEKKIGCRNCLECKKIINKNNLNIFYYEKENLTVEKFLYKINVKAEKEGYKIFVFKEAEKLSEIIQNKILKTIEEPSKETIIILCCKNENSLLQTIRSRCKKYYINEKQEKWTVANLIEKGYNDILAIKVANCSKDKRAEELIEEKSFEKSYDVVIDCLNNLKTSKDVAIFNNRMSENFNIVIEILEGLLYNVFKRINNEINYLSRDLIEVANNYNNATIINIFDIIYEIKRVKSLNVSPEILIDKLLYGILEVKYKCQ